MGTEKRVVVITGAAGGIGSALCHRFINDGATTFGVDRDNPGLQRLRNELDSSAFVPIHADIADEAGCRQLADRIASEVKQVDVLVNNAGYFPTRAFKDMTFSEWREVTAINLDSVFLITSLLLPLLKAGNRARIVNISSGSIFRGNAQGQCHYVAAKAGVVGLSRCLAWELAPDGINVNVVTPGVTATDNARKLLGAGIEAGRQRRAMQRDLSPQDIVGAVAFLASEDAASITGQIVNVDGGVNMH